MSRFAVRGSARTVLRAGIAAGAIIATLGFGACTYLWQTEATILPDRIQRGDFSFERPTQPGWYMRDTVDPPSLAEFTRHDGRAESQILIVSFAPEAAVSDAQSLALWAGNLPGGDKVITPAPNHGTTCLREHSRSVLALHDADSAAPSVYRMITDEDSLDCLDPRAPGFIVRFIYAQRSPQGATPAGNREADAFLSSIQYVK